jgi:ribonuclease E
MAKEMLINVSEGEECRIALLDDGKLEELYMERTSSTSHVGNIYKGRVTNVEPSIQAAFIDFGLGRNGFLHISDLMPSYFGRKGEDYTEAVGRKMSRRDRPPIQRCLRRGDDITVQIIKEGIGTKGPTLTTYLSIPGRILVMMPGMSKFGISRKIEDDIERRRLRGILDSLKPIDEVGFIIRTAGVGKTKTEIERDLKYLTRLWENITKKMKEPAPVELYTEGDLVTRTVRDVYTPDINRIVVDSKDVAKRIKEFFKIAMPRTKNKVEMYDEPIPLFHKAGIEHEIEDMYSRHVPLPSGGSLVIDSTEAIVAIDVNSGKFRDHADAETTAFKTDMEAADEIPRQLRLRDLGGVIICDFIDLRFERHRRDLERRLHDNLRNDRAKTKVLRMSQFGIIEMTRQRMRPSLKRSIYFDCPHCKGSGLVKTPESMSLDVMRKLAIAINDQRVARVELAVCPDVALYLLNKKRSQLANLEYDTKKKVLIRHDAQLGLDEMKLQLFDNREGLVFLEVLGMSPHDQLAPIQGGGRHDNRRGSGRGGRDDHRRAGGGRHGGPPHQHQQQQQRHDQRRPEPQHDRDDERFDEMEGDVEEAVEQRERQQADERAANVIAPAPVLASGSGATSEKRHPPLESENVIDVDEAVEPLGDAPGAIGDEGNGGENGGNGGRRRRRRRGRRGRGGRGRNGGGNGGNGPQGQQQSPQQAASRAAGADDDEEHAGDSDVDSEIAEQPTSITHESFTETHADGDVETEDIEATFGESEGTHAVVGTDESDESAEDESDESPGPGNERQPAETGSEDADQPKKRRRRRGGRRHRRRRDRADGATGPAQPNGNVADEAAEPTEEVEEEPQPVAAASPTRRGSSQRRGPSRGSEPKSSTPPPAPKAPVVPVPVVRTGSSDKHLIHDDEPIAPEPPRRPRTYRDLDAIPDDMD